MTEVLLLGRRSVREVLRYPEATTPTLFIPLFFLSVNVGQVAKTFPAVGTPFLEGQGYVAFQMPVSLMFAVVAPIRRTSLILGRLGADLVRGLAASTVVMLFGIIVFGAHVESGILGAILVIVLASLFGVAYAGF